MRKRNKKNWIIGAIVFLLVLTGCTVGGSYYMLNFSLTPNAKIRAKDADSYKYMYANYPFLRPWVDSLNKVNALRDTFILNPEGIRLHALKEGATSNGIKDLSIDIDGNGNVFLCTVDNADTEDGNYRHRYWHF